MRSDVARALTLAAFLVLATLPAGAHFERGRVECVQFAHIATSCTTGPHSALVTYEELAPLGTPLKHGILPPPSSPPFYTGTVESVLEWPAAAPTNRRVFRCTYRNSAPLGACTSSGYPPAPVASFMHRCFSYIESTSTPGGSGRFGCYVDHDDLGAPVVPPVLPG